MARITVEDCLEKIDSQYDLVLLAKERTSQLNAGEKALVPIDNDKNTVISLREIGEGKVSIKTLEEFAVNRLRKRQEDTTATEDVEDEDTDDFDKIYKGEISKSGTAILPSKRMRRMVEKTKFNLQDTTQVKNQEVKEEKEADKAVEEESKSADNKTE